MMLVQKPPQLPFSPPSAHRRHPSAPPAVVVQPTRTPGILSLSKPLRPTPPRQLHQQQPQKQVRSPKPKPATPQHRSPRPAQAEPTSTSHSIKPVSPKRASENAAPSGAKTQSASQSSTHAHARRNNVRQPSPISTSQAEAIDPSSIQTLQPPKRNPASNSFDPFLVSSDSDSDNARPSVVPPPSKRASTNTAPILSSYPSGKLARRRHLVPQVPATPTPSSKAIPVPRVGQKTGHNVSRSAPINSNVLSRPGMRRTSANFNAVFPICDDMTDVDDRSPPSTPTRERTVRYNAPWPASSFDDGPRTAPLFKSFGFPFRATPSPVARRHQRAPSEGVFDMSFDEDFSSSSSDASEELKMLFGLLPKRDGSVGPNKDKAGFFASSMFQNSPSPDELPPPAF
ncbi:hypothetical protein SERLA73DRAFT_84131 [Serpula lacrymans var. lacrymans S7.3]|uniref:Uncharacterized protein n=1 Tax=Serpula lacrymans var. lacrymans (strain S7.3) TaxID=936435 RepID=F8PKW5_SERL3|nr:hypothetical protein SERLA73DRAFT_84131 [Serpula lacrymans var. lacrymans S7.3]